MLQFKHLLVSLFIMLILTQVQAAQSTYVWWEGEDTLESNFPKSTWFSSSTFADDAYLLSESKWLTNDGNRGTDEAFATYQVSIPTDAVYDLWVRKFWKYGAFRWRFGSSEWRELSGDASLADSVTLKQHVPANWVFVGKVELPKGETTFELRLLAKQGEKLTSGFDCFVLSTTPFTPRGSLKPDDKSGKSDEGFFPWEPAPDAFTDDALLDLRHLNETVAGQNGFVKREGLNFTLGDGSSVRFWAVNVSSSIAGLDRGSVDYLARWLAKSGVNMVRFHSPMFNQSDPMTVNQTKLDNLFYLVHAMKKQGIYTSLSFYFPLWFNIQPHYGIPGYNTTANKKPFVLLYYNERMQEIYDAWCKAILTTASPYSGKPLADDPAVAIVEILNEDSFFFWTFSKNNIPAIHWEALEKQFGQWLAQRYGSIDSAFTAWGTTRLDSDSTTDMRAGLYEAYQMTGGAIKQSNTSKKKRVGDQVRFFTETQRGFYAKTVSFMKNDLDCKSLISPSNWHVSDPVMLDALERYTYTAGDVIDRHGYFSGPHSSSDGTHSYSVRVGHTFQNRAAVTIPDNLPLQFIQTDGYPQTITEIGWTNPNLYRADYSFLASAYGSLQGIDAIYAFAVGGASWDTDMKKFALTSPAILGNSPAYALLYRRGDVQEAENVVYQVVDLEDLYAMKGSGGATAQNFDEFRQSDVPPGAQSLGEVNSIDPFAYYVGRVMRTYGTNTSDSYQVNLENDIDRNAKIITSRNKQLTWQYGQGLAKINTPNSQGAAGFLSQAGTINLSDISIQCANEYATIIVTSLDGKPVNDSDTILIQVMTVERPYGFKATEGKQGRITDLGGYPFGVEKITASITLNLNGNQSIQVIPLDENGYPKSNKTTQINTSENGTVTFSLEEDSVYTIIKRAPSSTSANWSQHTYASNTN